MDIEAIITRESNREFDLSGTSAQPQVRAALLRLQRDLHVVVLSFPRVACDAWSTQVFARQLVALLLHDEPVFALATPVAFAQLALREARLLSGSDPALAAMRHYWARELADTPVLQPARDEDVPGLPHAHTRFRMSRSNIVAFGELLVLPTGARADAADITMLLCLSAWLVALQQTLGMADFVVGLLVSVRDLHPTGAVGLLAPLSAVIPLRVRMSRAHSFVDLFLDVGRRVDQARSHAQCPAPPLDESVGPCFPVQV